LYILQIRKALVKEVRAMIFGFYKLRNDFFKGIWNAVKIIARILYIAALPSRLKL